MIRRPPRPPLFPSTTLFRSVRKRREGGVHLAVQRPSRHGGFVRRTVPGLLVGPLRLLQTVRLPPPPPAPPQLVERPITDRKSTRLNSSHSQISYAVFCLKKK